jgi:hypothetical protein
MKKKAQILDLFFLYWTILKNKRNSLKIDNISAKDLHNRDIYLKRYVLILSHEYIIVINLKFEKYILRHFLRKKVLFVLGARSKYKKGRANCVETQSFDR